MLWILIKKQLLYMFSGVFNSKKTGRKRTPREMVLVILGIIALAVMIASSMSLVSYELAKALIPAGFNWIYFTICAFLGVMMSATICMFMSYNLLYDAKDNEMLMAMPINPKLILVSRLSSVYLYALAFSAIITVPSFIFYLQQAAKIAGITFGAVIANIVLILVLPLIAVTISCILGYILALIMPRVKHKSLVTTVFSLLFLIIYYIFVGYQNTFIDEIEKYLLTLSETNLKTNPLYIVGKAFDGNMLYLLIIVAIVAGLFALVYYLISRSYLVLATTKTGGVKVAYKEKQIKTNSYRSALLKRELRHFVYSPAYLLNCGLGCVIILIAGIFLAIKVNDARSVLAMLPDKYTIAVIGCLAIQYITSMSPITSPSISLEAKTINILRSLPIRTWDILKTKLDLHLLFVGIPTIITMVIVIIVAKLDLFGIITLVIFTIAIVAFSALFGLVANLLLPRMQWNNETEVVKRSGSVVISIFAGWIVTGLFALVYFMWLIDIVDLKFYFSLVVVFYLIADGAMLLWLMNKGTKKFELL